MMPHISGRRSLAVVALAVAGLGFAAGSRADSTTGPDDKAIEPAISRPAEEEKPAFAAPGVVAEVMVKEGDHVRAGQVIAKQDDAEELLALASLQSDADNMAEIDYEQVDKENKEQDYKRKKDLYDQPGHNAALSEVDQARLAVRLAEAQIIVAQQKHDKAGIDVKKERVKIDRMQLRSKVDGVVAKVVTHAGEMADPASKDGAITIVANDPLWVEMHPSTDRALKLQLGQDLQARYAAPPGEQPGPWQSAKIIYFAPQADASSKTELVRLELPNPDGQWSGLAMEVRLPANVAAVAAGGTAGPGTAPGLPPLSN